MTQREMRNNSGAILRAVAAGETIQVTDSGRIAALIVPAPQDPLDDLIDRGQARAAIRPDRPFAAIPRVNADVTSAEIVEDLRNAW